MAAPSVLVMPNAAVARPELAELLGVQRLQALEGLLMERTVQWAQQVSGGEGRMIPGAAGETLADAVERALGETAGEPLLVAWPVLPRWRVEHAEAVLDDLQAGCGASVGPVFDGGLYLLALARPLPSLLALPEEAWDGPAAMGAALTAINEAGVSAGLLRAERGLRRAGDVRAVLADPLLDEELRPLLV